MEVVTVAVIIVFRRYPGQIFALLLNVETEVSLVFVRSPGECRVTSLKYRLLSSPYLVAYHDHFSISLVPYKHCI